MANWASTSYAIEGSKEELNKLYELIEGFMKHKLEPVTETASDGWEGYIVKSLGATDKIPLPAPASRTFKLRLSMSMSNMEAINCAVKHGVKN
jgi:hypothetical protein